MKMDPAPLASSEPIRHKIRYLAQKAARFSFCTLRRRRTRREFVLQHYYCGCRDLGIRSFFVSKNKKSDGNQPNFEFATHRIFAEHNRDRFRYWTWASNAADCI